MEEEEVSPIGHCVATDALLCHAGHSSIWSLTVEDWCGRAERLLTLEVQNWRREIVQARGRRNRWPHPEELRILNLWASAGGPSLARQVLYTMADGQQP